VVHRDVKADNVFLTADGRAVIGDWGEGMLLYTGGIRPAIDRTIRLQLAMKGLPGDESLSNGAAPPGGLPFSAPPRAGSDRSESSNLMAQLHQNMRGEDMSLE